MQKPAHSGSRAIRTTCPYCGVGCGVHAATDGRGAPSISGDVLHPSNFGKLCSKGSALAETLSLSTRLLHPEIGGRRVSWDEALDRVADALKGIRNRHGPDSIAFYLSGQLLTEDYYVANKLAKGFIGTPNVDTNSRLCMASSVAGHKRAFGADVVPGSYEDLDEADLVVLTGSNTAWCHPILFQRIQKARASKGTKVINIDPRRTATSDGADLQLSLASGSDTCLWNGLLVWLADHGHVDFDYVASHTEGFEAALDLARDHAGSISRVAFNTGLTTDEVAAFFELWSVSARVVTCYSQGVNQSVQGTDKVNAIINCHLATGRIAKPGAGPLSLTGQPNAMGGREVGGLANMLAAHMGFSDRERDIVRRFWRAPNLVSGEGLKAVDMFTAVARGDIKGLWVMGTNPAVSLPRADAMRAALANLDCFVISEVVSSNDTIHHASIRLPASAWGEKDGTVTNSERRISRQRPFLPPAGESRPDWWIVAQVAERLGWGSAFRYASAADIFREHAALSGFENHGERVFNISGLATLSDGDYETLEPVQWPVFTDRQGTKRVFADQHFATPTGRARFVPVSRKVDRPAPSDAWPLVLNTGRIRDQWHTMTRTGLSARLSVHISEPFVEINPADAAIACLEDGALARIETAHGAAVVRVVVTDRVAAGNLFAPIHWSDENSSAGCIGALVHDAADPVSGQPDLKATPARISPVEFSYAGFLLSPEERNSHLSALEVVYWARAKVAAGWLTTFAIDGSFAMARKLADAMIGAGPRTSVADEFAGLFRSAVVADGAIASLVFLSRSKNLQPSTWIKDMLGQDALSIAERRAILAGTNPQTRADEGPIVCVCHQVGANRIGDAIARGCRTADAIGRDCGAGTNCGSCLPEIHRMLSREVSNLRHAGEPCEASAKEATGVAENSQSAV